MNLYNETMQIMKRNNILPNKKFGQNFLIDENVVSEIIEKSKITKDDLIIEIGPGLGTLTKELLKVSGKVICIELDYKMVKVLEKRFSEEKNLEIISQDILKLDLKELLNEELKTYKNAKVVANLPYYITTPIIMKLLEEKLNIQSITVMIQKEVADRLVAKPGANLAGAITYAIHYYSLPQKIINVPSSSFIPSPEVDSAVIQLQILPIPSITISDEELLFKVIRQAFSQRRKTLVNALTNFQELDKSYIIKMLNDLHFDIKIRGEKLTLEDYAKIVEYISK